MRLSIVGTLFYSEPYIVEFYQRITTATQDLTEDYEIIFVNDGSPDRSKELVLELQARDPRIVLIDLSRNFGHHKAIMTGLMHAKGDHIFLIDTDLEEDPEGLLPLWNEIQQKPELHVVYGVQKSRKGNRVERVSGAWYYRFIKMVTGYSYPLNTLTSRIMSKTYVDALRMYREKEFDLWTLFVLNGFKQQGIFMNKKSKGKSTYTFKRKVRIAIDMVTSYSTMPLYWVLVIGLVVLSIAFFFCLLLLYQFLYQKHITAGMPLIVSIWLIGGLLLSALGIISIYLSKMFLEIKDRPVSIIEKIYTANK